MRIEMEGKKSRPPTFEKEEVESFVVACILLSCSLDNLERKSRYSETKQDVPKEREKQRKNEMTKSGGERETDSCLYEEAVKTLGETEIESVSQSLSRPVNFSDMKNNSSVFLSSVSAEPTDGHPHVSSPPLRFAYIYFQ